MKDKRRKAVVFSLDILIALSIMFLVMYNLSSVRYIADSPSSKHAYMNMLAQDAIMVISKAKISELTEVEAVSYYISTGDIQTEDINNTLADILGTFIVKNETDKARNISESLFKEFLSDNVGYEFYLNNVSFFNNSSPYSNTQISVKTILSGYDINKSTEGYIARAWLETATYNETLLVPISPAGSGFEDPTCVRWWWFICTETTNGGQMNLTKSFEIPSDAQEITSAYFYISLHSNWGDIHLYMNDVHQHSDSLTGTYYEKVEIQNLTIGNNTLKIVMDEPSDYHAHTHPGLLLEVNYLKQRRIGYFENRTFAGRIYLPEVLGHPVAWGIFPIHIPRNSTINEATVHIEAEDVDDYYELWVNDQRILQEGSPAFNPTIDTDISSYLHINDGLASGETDVVSVYFDMEAQNDYPTRYAEDNCTIRNTSYIFINYTKPEEVKKYGIIPLTQVLEFGPPASNDKQIDFNISEYEIINAFLHLAQEYSWKVAVATWYDPETAPSWDNPTESWIPSYMQIFKSPTGRNVPSEIYVPLDRMASNTTNHIRARDDSGNDILPNSTIEFKVLVPAGVGYGEVVENETEALQNATDRLQELLNPYQIQGDMTYDSSSIQGISWLWGPAELKVVLWS